MFEVIFLSILALIWIIFATVQDIRTREVANWLNFSLIIFALAFRLIYSIFSQTNLMFFYQGLIGFGIFFVLANLLYYGRMFAGGDAKLLMALGAILPISNDLITNLKISATFFLVLLVVGAIYGLVWSFALVYRNFKEFKKDFAKKFKKFKKLFYSVMFLGIIFMVLGFIEDIFLFIGIVVFLLPYFYLYARSIDDVCMVKKIKTKNLREGDWLYKNVKVGRKTIKAKWEGLSNKEIKYLKKKKRFLKIRQGIPFVPVFLITFVLLVILYFLRNPSW